MSRIRRVGSCADSLQGGQFARSSRLVALLLALALVAAACGNGDDADEDVEAADDVETEDDTDDAEDDAADAEDDAADAEDDAADADDAEAVDLTGEEVQVIVQYPAGGGFDLQARELANRLEADFEVAPVVFNEEGAGGVTALNNHAAEEPNTLRIQYIQTPAAIGSQVGGAEGVRYDLSEFDFLGRMIVDPVLLVANTESGYESFEDVLAADEPSFAVTGPGGIDYLTSAIIDESFDEIDANLVTGFDGGDEARQGLLRGDAELTAFSERSLVAPVEDGDVIPLAVVGGEPSENFPDVPLITDFAEEGSLELETLEGLVGLIESGRTFAAVPGTDEATVAALRDMVEEVLQSEELIQFVEDAGDQYSFLSGEETTELVHGLVTQGGAFEEVLQGAV